MDNRETIRRRLNWVTWVAIIDAVALVVLLWAAFSDRDGIVSILGPVHGGGFILLCVLIGIGCLEKLWLVVPDRDDRHPRPARLADRRGHPPPPAERAARLVS